MDIRIGCRGFAASKEKYVGKLGLVEIDETVRELPDAETAAEWASGVPSGFEFTVRAPRSVSEGCVKDPERAAGAWRETRRIADILGSSVIILRSPESFKRTDVNMGIFESFLSRIDRKGMNLVWEAPSVWKREDVFTFCRDNGIIPAVDPFRDVIPAGELRYLTLPGMDGAGARYRGLDLKKLRDLLENETPRSGNIPSYAVFSNRDRFHDAMRFDWIVENTGRVREIDDGMLKALCAEIEAREEDQKVLALSREAERIVALILFTEYKKVDIEIEAGKLREMCGELFPNKEYLYDMIYGKRFERLWEQFRERD